MCIRDRDYPVLSDLHALMEEEYQRVRSTEGGELYTPELLRSACLGLHSMCVGADAKFFNGHTNLQSDRLVFFNVKDLMEGGKNIKDAMPVSYTHLATRGMRRGIFTVFLRR